jgi:hypothetical protein
LILLLGLAGLFGRARNRADGILVVMLGAQLMIWFFGTHGYARFAVPILIPLSVLAGRAALGRSTRWSRWTILVAMVAGTSWSFFHSARMHARESSGGVPASLIYQGKLGGYEYLGTINGELPTDAKLLLLGEAKAFYFQRTVDYCVVFNRNRIADVIGRTGDEATLVDWLRREEYSHVLVHWPEIERLSRTYGLELPITRDGFERLAATGRLRRREFAHPQVRGPYVELYEVPPSP